MKRLIQLFLLLPLLWVAGCQKEVSEQRIAETGTVGEKTVKIQATLAEPKAVSKALVLGESFFNGFDYGIFVCDHGTPYSRHKQNSWNLKASYQINGDNNEGVWSYQYIDNLREGTLTSNQYENITITDKQDNDNLHVTADLFAYAPYVPKAYKNDPTRIPFTIARDITKQNDLMYAEENGDPAKNKGLDPLTEGDDPLEVSFTFKHALALLAFDIQELNNNGDSDASTYMLNSIKVNSVNAETGSTSKLYNGGYFNALDGSFNCAGYEAKSITVIQGSGFVISPNNQRLAYMVLVPTEIEDNELEFVFTMNTGAPMELHHYRLKKADLLHSDGSRAGFKGGYKYTFHFTLDNYLYLNDIEISDSWEEGILEKIAI